MAEFRLCWKSGKVEIIEGDTISEAFSLKGYTALDLCRMIRVGKIKRSRFSRQTILARELKKVAKTRMLY